VPDHPVDTCLVARNNCYRLDGFPDLDFLLHCLVAV
jgi:hypothetical protein